MKIWHHLQSEGILLDVSLPDKETLLHFIADKCRAMGIVNDPNSLYEGMKQRENTMTTGIGDGIGLPHTTCAEVNTASVLLIRLTCPIEFDSIDGRPVDIILSLIIPENAIPLHIQLLAGISRLCRQSNFLNLIRQAEHPDILMESVRQLEEKMTFH
ncbi:MAG: PTS sugar transporter subunit IIA [Desulfobacterales bacterium]|nr:PTS sugar transporter subunit IIA [Desulfobacterales bacterium]MDD4072242.1 PTS sugar transporter subunit IIA [Desulfobacterales bacterium]MDD4392971.1 PTS sugar transporter subunit IIA [Desulfobacterales bacterium]